LLYRSFVFLQRATRKVPDWNFAKYLVSRDGRDITFHEAAVEPLQLQQDIERLLEQPA